MINPQEIVKQFALACALTIAGFIILISMI